MSSLKLDASAFIIRRRLHIGILGTLEQNWILQKIIIVQAYEKLGVMTYIFLKLDQLITFVLFLYVQLRYSLLACTLLVLQKPCAV